ncbi:MAG: hypothetical protein R3F56_04965 [Planctomycetota bacterium]
MPSVRLRIVAGGLAGIVSVSLTSLALPAQGQANEVWSQTLTRNGSQLYGAMIGIDGSDAIYVTGHSPGVSIETARLRLDGTLLWQVEFANGGTHTHADWLAVDAFGDVVVAGHVVAGGNRTPSGFVTLKYDPAGNLLWSDVIPSTFGSLARVATDAQGDVVVLGRTWGAVGSGIVLIKYARQGGRLWMRTTGLSSSNQDAVGALAIDAGGNIFATGGVLGTMLTFAYDAAGNPLWSHSLPAMGSGLDLALGPAGEVYVGGVANGTTTDRSLVAKYDRTGNLAWTRNYPGNSVRRLGVDRHGDVVITGPISPAGGYFNWLTQKLDPGGTVLWTATYDQHRYNDEVPYGLCLGPDDEIYITGQGGPGPTSGVLSYLRTVTVRYARSGVEEWVASTFDSVRGLGVVRHADNSLSVVGESTFTAFHYAQTGVWRSLEGALAGSQGPPRLLGVGAPVGANPVRLDVSDGVANAPAWLVVGLARVNLPILGGVLVPSPDLVLGGLSLTGGGDLSLPLTWPRGLSSGFEVTFQVWLADVAAPRGFAATNALAGVSR